MRTKHQVPQLLSCCWVVAHHTPSLLDSYPSASVLTGFGFARSPGTARHRAVNNLPAADGRGDNLEAGAASKRLKLNGQAAALTAWT